MGKNMDEEVCFQQAVKIARSVIQMIEKTPEETPIGYTLAHARYIVADYMRRMSTKGRNVSPEKTVDIALDFVLLELIWLQILYKQVGVDFFEKLKEKIPHAENDANRIMQSTKITVEKAPTKSRTRKKIQPVTQTGDPTSNEKIRYIT